MMHRNLVVFSMIASLASVSASADCQQKYLDRTRTNGISIAGNSGNAFELSSYYLAIGLGASSGVALGVAFGIPLATEGVILIVDHIQDAHLLNMMRVLDKSAWMSGKTPLPELRADFVDVNGATRQARREQRRHNQEVQDHNREVTKELLKSDQAFEEFYGEVAKKVTHLTAMELAQAITTANTSDEFCNGLIGNDGKTLTLQQEVAETGPTDAERRAQRKHNRKVRRENERAVRRYDRHMLAKKSDAVDYFAGKLH